MATTERRLPEQELAPLVDVLAGSFIRRWDKHPRQLADGRYVTIHAPLTRTMLAAHLRGVETLGAYILDCESRARFMVLDADNEPDRRRLVALAQVLAQLSCPSYLEASRRGAHLWFFFEQPIDGGEVRRFGNGLLAYFNLDTIELYPKQPTLRGDGPGSLIRLPFGVHRKSGRRYGFYTPNGEPLAPTLSAQILALSAPLTVPERLFYHYGEYAAVPLPKPVFEPSDAAGDRPSDRIKVAVKCYDFLSRYVPLSPSGRGRCPFHDDQVASFSVNQEENYWHCFAGCGGGSVIDFWMNWRKVDFVTAVGELSEMLLA